MSGSNGSATYSGNEIFAEFRARGVLSDYGVPRSPAWTEWVDPEIARLEILGREVDWKTLPTDVVNDIIDLTDELTFTPDEYDGPDRKEED